MLINARMHCQGYGENSSRLPNQILSLQHNNLRLPVGISNGLWHKIIQNIKGKEKERRKVKAEYTSVLSGGQPPNETPKKSKMDIKSKVDQIVRYLFVMSIQIILQSRIPVRGQSAAESTASPSSSSPKEIEEFPFNLALKKFPTDVAALEACKKNGFRSVVLDVLPIQSPQQQTEVSFRHGKLQKFLKTVMSQQPDRRSVLERWVLQYVKHEDGQNAEKQTYSMERMIARVYKSTMVLMRSLISMTRLLPAYRAFQLANTSSYGKFFGLWYQFLQLPQPLLHGEGTHMNSYKFPSINVPFGKICLSVDYRSLVASDFNFPSAPRLPKIVPDYYRGGSTTDPVKILSDDCYSKNMMLNFGGSLPLTGSALSAPPSDSYRNEDSNYCKFATTSLRHSYIQRALQTIPLSRSRSCRCMAFSPLKQLHCDVLCTKQTERVPRTFPVDKSALMFSGAYDYCREVEVAASLPFAVDNDSSVNSLSRENIRLDITYTKMCNFGDDCCLWPLFYKECVGRKEDCALCDDLVFDSA
ncbi:autophagy-related protein 13a isoform X4 [Cryptomeria japonica]|uniref:autophagy-related protein 13a isoform X4 n=1 Tax=Cryptomeria japonica TaxID=3369 RepID=UPI0025AC6DEC|nr:autophagy-related protein 13a isoform X4 [Cryptomeria japonica]